MPDSGRTTIWINLAAIVVLIAGIRAAESILVPFLVAGFLAVISFPLLDWMTERRVPVAVAVCLVLLIAVALLGGLGVVVSQSVQSFTDNLPNYEQRLSEQFASGREWLEGTGVQVPMPDFGELVSATSIFNITGVLVSGIGVLLTNVVLILLSYVFLLFEAKGFPSKLHRAFGEQSNTLENLEQMAAKMKQYLALKALLSLGTGVPVWLFLAVMGVDYPVLWGLLAFLLNFIPNIGSVIAAVPPVLLALIQYGAVSAIIVAVFYIAINTVVGNILEPRLMGQGFGLSTFVVFAALVFWGWVLGAVGMFLAVPLTIMVQIVLASNPQTRSIAILLGGDIEEAPVTGTADA